MRKPKYEFDTVRHFYAYLNFEFCTYSKLIESEGMQSIDSITSRNNLIAICREGIKKGYAPKEIDGVGCKDFRYWRTVRELILHQLNDGSTF